MLIKINKVKKVVLSLLIVIVSNMFFFNRFVFADAIGWGDKKIISYSPIFFVAIALSIIFVVVISVVALIIIYFINKKDNANKKERN